MDMDFPDTNLTKIEIEELTKLIDKFGERNRLKEELEELDKLISDSQKSISEFPERFSLKIGLYSLKIRKEELLEKEANLIKEIDLENLSSQNKSKFVKEISCLIGDIIWQGYKETNSSWQYYQKTNLCLAVPVT
ncbi:hypothetical protein [Methanosarcina barkeri]|uniref:Uncharacterized protein n=1 Tax=Methanosarcina barkeri CM1 TaxID=796385 RepID=A0A0G3CFY6_METBA|nr:hypothetical protein [Methanosarcina barkeri]AKJ38002.1 hypothetical protein MCM1_0939 [Methanosarcina barkeri CM1]